MSVVINRSVHVRARVEYMSSAHESLLPHVDFCLRSDVLQHWHIGRGHECPEETAFRNVSSLNLTLPYTGNTTGHR
jgi:hypothetical protein